MAKYITTYVGTYKALIGNKTPWAAHGGAGPSSQIDVDGDGKSELIFSGRQAALPFPQDFSLWSDSPILIYKSIGGKWVDFTKEYIPNQLDRQVRGVEAIPLVADFNRDGLVDFIVAGGTDMPYVAPNYMYKNIGGKFERIEIGTPSWTHGSDMADINGDGFIDVFFIGFMDPYFQIGLGSASGFKFFKVVAEKSFGGIGPAGGTDVTFADFLNNEDGKLDLILSDSDIQDPDTGADISLYSWDVISDDAIEIKYLNTLPPPYFSSRPALGFKGSHDARTHALDFNNDGLMDLMVCSLPGAREPGYTGDYTPTSSLQFFQNKDGGEFVDATEEFLLGYNNYSQADYDPVFVDVNDDGLTDIFLGGGGKNSVALLLKSKEGPYREVNRDFFSELIADAFATFRGDTKKLTDPYVLSNSTLAERLKNPMQTFHLAEILEQGMSFSGCKLVKVEKNIFVLTGTFDYELPELDGHANQYKLVWQVRLRFDHDGKPAIISTGFWRDQAMEPTTDKNTDAVNLTDAISVLKMIVGLNVNSNGAPLSPYQSIAADFDQNGDVNLLDAIGVLKKIVGLSAPTPAWKYYDDAKLTSAFGASQSLNPKVWAAGALISDATPVDAGVKLIGVLTGDVDGSWAGV
jgi:hypothetical protein